MCCLWAGLPILVSFNIPAVTQVRSCSYFSFPYWMSLIARTVWSASACAVFMFACIVCNCYIIPSKTVAVFHCRNSIVSYLIWCCCFLSHSTSTQISSNFKHHSKHWQILNMVDHTLMATVPVSDLCRIECINIMTNFVYVYSYLHDDHSSCLQMCMYGTRKKSTNHWM